MKGHDMKNTINIYDADRCENIEAVIIRSNNIDDGIWHEVEVEDMQFAIIEYDNEIVSQKDWQAVTVEAENINDECWQDVTPQ